MSPQQFSLRWNNHTKNLVQVFAEQFEREQHVDVTISCQGRFLKAHKIVLGACSPYFQELFDAHESTPHPIIIMNGYNFEDVRNIVEFMYRGEVMVAETAMQRLLAAAEDLQIKGLSNVRSKRDSQHSQDDGDDGGSSVCSGSNSNGGRSAGSSPQQGASRRAPGQFSPGESNANETNRGNNFSPPEAVSTGGRAEKQGTPPFVRRRKRASRTVSYDNELKRKVRAKFSPPEDAPAATEGGANGEHQNQDDTVEDDGDKDVLMTINIEPPMLADVDGKPDEEEQSNGGNDVMKAFVEMEPKEKIPRPPNSFMIFANEWRRQLASQFPNESNKEISVRLGLMWKNLTDEVKAKYFTAARRANDDHKKKYPDYHYNPKEARMRKMWKLQQQSMGHLVTTASPH